MKPLLTILFALLLTGDPYAQHPADVFRTAQKINLFHSSREDVQKLFAHYGAGVDDDAGAFEFSGIGIGVEISYANGECSEDPDSRDFEAIWKVKKGKAVKVEISFEDPVQLELFNVDVTTLLREQTDEDEVTSYGLFSKSMGIMFEIEESGVERIVLFPPAAKAKSLCHDNTWGKQFYSSKGWSNEFRMAAKSIAHSDLPPNVDELNLSATFLAAADIKVITVATLASDPENNVLTYDYVVSGGRIRGAGPSVAWDLIGVPPGTYTITATVDDGCGICGRTVTKSITIR